MQSTGSVFRECFHSFIYTVRAIVLALAGCIGLLVSEGVVAQDEPQLTLKLHWYADFNDPESRVCDDSGARVGGGLGIELRMRRPAGSKIGRMWAERLRLRESSGPHAGQAIDITTQSPGFDPCLTTAPGDYRAIYGVSTESYHNGPRRGEIVYGYELNDVEHRAELALEVIFDNLVIHSQHATPERVLVIDYENPGIEKRRVSASFTGAQIKNTYAILAIYSRFAGLGHEPSPFRIIRIPVRAPAQSVSFVWDERDIPDGVYGYDLWLSEANTWQRDHDDRATSGYLFVDPVNGRSSFASFEGMMGEDEEKEHRYWISYRLGENDRRGLTSRRDASEGEVVIYVDGAAVARKNIAELPCLHNDQPANGLETGPSDNPREYVCEVTVPEKSIPEGKEAYALLLFTDDRADDDKAHRQRPTPTKVLKIDAPVEQVVAGSYHNLVLKRDKTVWAWGSGIFGSLGNGGSENSNRPVQVKDHTGTQHLKDFAYVFAGGSHSFAIARGGNVWAWGLNIGGQLGDETLVNRFLPIRTKGRNGEGELSASWLAAGERHSLAYSRTGAILAWGVNLTGQLGIGDDLLALSSFPRQVPIVSSGLVSAGAYHSLLRERRDQSLWAWGDNSYGQLGDGTTTRRYAPVQVKDATGLSFFNRALQAVGGDMHTLAMQSGGRLWAWGRNTRGQLGDNTETSRLLPVRVSGLGGAGTFDNAVTIAAGSFHSLAVRSDRTLSSWGDNRSGQLGIGTEPFMSNTPRAVLGPSGVGLMDNIMKRSWHVIAAGSAHSLALKDDGTLYAWGANFYGQLGDGTNTQRVFPVRVRFDVE